MHPVERNDRRIGNIHQADFTPFVHPDGMPLDDTICNSTPVIFWAWAFTSPGYPPGMTTRGHRQNCHRQFLIIEGGLHESDGTKHNPYLPNSVLWAVHIAAP